MSETSVSATVGVRVTGIEFVIGYLVAWVVRKACRVGERADAEVDTVLDSGMDRFHDLVARKLGGDPALAQPDE